MPVWFMAIAPMDPYAPEHGHRFNHHKLLLDPYARALAGTLHWSDALYGFRQHSARGDLSFDRRDSAALHAEERWSLTIRSIGVTTDRRLCPGQTRSSMRRMYAA